MADQQHLCHFHIGPVQSFIAAGRRTQDLYVGSWLLSELARAGVEAAQQAHADLLYPAAVKGKLPASIPNLFAFLTEDEPQGVCEYVEDAVRRRWTEISGQVQRWLEKQVGGGDWEPVFQRQVENWMELYWVAVSYDASKHSESFAEVKRAMAQRKNARHFPQINEPGWKCTVTGAGQSLPLDWDRLRRQVGDIELRPNERQGALALIKRFAQRAGVLTGDPFPSTEHIAGVLKPDQEETPRGKELEGYFAILHMDGDQMGQKLSELKRKEKHQQFSAALAHFADQIVPEIVKRYDQKAKGSRRGRAALVYAGGDDVLALLPVRDALACADEIRQEYTKALQSADLPNATMSAGIAIIPTNYPLDIALDIARAAEKSAKERYGRDAVVVTEAHGTQQRIAGAKWEQGSDSIANLVSELTQAFSKPAWLSAKIGYDLNEMAYALNATHIPAAARQAEVARLVKRRTETFQKGSDAQTVITELAPRLCAWGEHKNVGWESLANWVILARFLASDGKREV
jgi:CRISPR-associated protein Cmr2